MQGLAIIPLIVALADVAGAGSGAGAPPGASAGAPAPERRACVTAIRVAELSDRTRVEIDIPAGVYPVVGRSPAGDGVVCGFGPCDATLPLPDKTIESPRVASVRVTDLEGATQVEITFATTEIQYRYTRLDDPPRLVVDLFGTGGTPPVRKPASVASGPAARGADDLMALGEKALANGEADRGLAYLEAAVALGKTTASKRDLLVRIARRARAEGLHAQAIRCYARALGMGPPDTLAASVRLEMGESLAAHGDVAAALAAWDTVIAFGKGTRAIAARRARADCLLREGRGVEAVDDLSALARNGRDGLEEAYAGYRLGLVLLAEGRADEALAAFEGVSPNAAEGDSATAYFARAALLRRGDLLYESGRHGAAAVVYERVVAHWGDTEDAAWALFQIGNAERRAGRAAAALERYRAALAGWPQGRWAPMAAWGVDECKRLLAEADGAGGAAADDRVTRRGGGR